VRAEQYHEAAPLLRRAAALAEELEDDQLRSAVDQALTQVWSATRAQVA
jgi:hypothetical protein